MAGTDWGKTSQWWAGMASATSGSSLEWKFLCCARWGINQQEEIQCNVCSRPAPRAATARVATNSVNCTTMNLECDIHSPSRAQQALPPLKAGGAAASSGQWWRQPRGIKGRGEEGGSRHSLAKWSPLHLPFFRGTIQSG